MPISKQKVDERTNHWQRCLHDQIPGLFYAYDETQQRSERVVSYRLSQKDVAILKQLKPELDYQLSFMLACKKPKKEEQIGNSPVFAPILALDYKTAKNKAKTEYFELEWEPNPHFLEAEEHTGILSGIDAIPAAGAFLFVFNWLKQTYEQLPQVFETMTSSLLGRVRSYFYSTDESNVIIKEIKTHSDSDTDVSIYLHLGVGISVQYHPYSFRPVIEVHLEKQNEQGNAMWDLAGSTFYDFSRPCPHYCKD